MSKFIIEPHFRLQEWVAREKGYFDAEGLDYEFRELIRSTDGLNSATIVIADREGRKEIAKAIRNLPSPAPSPAHTEEPARPAFATVPQVIGVVAILAAAGIVWLIFR